MKMVNICRQRIIIQRCELSCFQKRWLTIDIEIIFYLKKLKCLQKSADFILQGEYDFCSAPLWGRVLVVFILLNLAKHRFVHLPMRKPHRSLNDLPVDFCCFAPDPQRSPRIFDQYKLFHCQVLLGLHRPGATWFAVNELILNAAVWALHQ